MVNIPWFLGFHLVSTIQGEGFPSIHSNSPKAQGQCCKQFPRETRCGLMGRPVIKTTNRWCHQTKPSEKHRKTRGKWWTMVIQPKKMEMFEGHMFWSLQLSLGVKWRLVLVDLSWTPVNHWVCVLCPIIYHIISCYTPIFSWLSIYIYKYIWLMWGKQ